MQETQETQEMQVQSLGWDDPWSKKWQPLSILAWSFPCTEEPGRLQFMGSQKVKHMTKRQYTHMHTKIVEQYTYNG